MNIFTGPTDYVKAWGRYANAVSRRAVTVSRDRLSASRRKPAPRGRRLVVRNFDAANKTRLDLDWTSDIANINSILASQYGILVGRSRNETRNDDYGRNYIRLIKNNVVGPNGVIVQAKSRDANGKLDIEANRTIEAAHRDWSDGKHCDVAGKQTWPEMQRLWAATAAKDGDAIMMKHYTGKYGYALQFIDSLCLDYTLNEPVRNGRRIVCGVEMDNLNRPLAYYFKTGGYSSRHQRFSADVIMHAFVYEDVGQARGYPWMSTSMPRMNMLKGFEDAALVASRAGANNLTWIETPTGTEYTGDGVNEDGTIAVDSEPGSMNQVAAGTKIHDTDPAYPHQAYGDMVNQQAQGIAAGLGVSQSGLTGNLNGANYSSMRSGKLDEQATWMPLQNWMIANLNAPAYSEWIMSAISLGVIKFPHGAPLPMNKLDKYSAVEFQPKRWPWVDPKKDEDAVDLRIAGHRTSVSASIRQTGGDPDTVFAEIAADNKKLAELGITKEESNGDAEG